MLKKIWVKILVIVIAFAMLMTGAILFIGFGVYGESQSTETEVNAGDRPTAAATIPPEILKKRGPRPQNTRLRNNTRQVETSQDAITSAKQALARVEKELAGAKDDAALARLERKKRLIEQTIARLSGKK